MHESQLTTRMTKLIITLFAIFIIVSYFIPAAAGIELRSSTPIRIVGKENVEIANKKYNIYWNSSQSKFNTSLLIIENCSNVVIKDCTFDQNNSDFKAYHTIILLNCKNVTIENCKFTGTCASHIRTENCENVRISNCTFSGTKYDKTYLCGGGIFVDNWSADSEMRREIRNETTHRFNTIIDYCIFENNQDSSGENRDGILLHSPGAGRISGCVATNWTGGDTVFDISHRSDKSWYKNNVFRVYNNRFFDANRVKTPGRSDRSNTILFYNNIYYNTFIGDYHYGYNVGHYYETFIFPDQTFSFYRLWGLSSPGTDIHECLIVCDGLLKSLFYQNEVSSQFKYIRFTNNVILTTELRQLLLAKDSIENIAYPGSLSSMNLFKTLPRTTMRLNFQNTFPSLDALQNFTKVPNLNLRSAYVDQISLLQIAPKASVGSSALR